MDRTRRFSGSRVQTAIPNEARVGSSLYGFDLFMGAVTLTGCLSSCCPNAATFRLLRLLGLVLCFARWSRFSFLLPTLWWMRFESSPHTHGQITIAPVDVPGFAAAALQTLDPIGVDFPAPRLTFAPRRVASTCHWSLYHSVYH